VVGRPAGRADSYTMENTLDWGARMRLRAGVAAVASLVALWAVANTLSPDARANSPRALPSSVSSLDHLGEAIGRFARADRGLFAPDAVGRSGGRWIRPVLGVPRYGHDEFGPSVSTSLFGAPSRMEVELFNSGQDLDVGPPDAAGSPEISLPSELAERSSSLYGVAGSAGAAFVVAGVQRDTDVLFRALPFGVSVYVLFSSAYAPERITFDTNLGCPTSGFQLDRRLESGTFSYEEELTSENEEDECGLYSHAPVAPVRPPSPTDTTAAYQAESSLFALADRQAHRDQAIAALEIRAYPAHDDAGHEVPTEMAWRAEGEQPGPVIRVHLKAGHARFPVLMRFDVVAQP
jgi:hypothetical protein